MQTQRADSGQSRPRTSHRTRGNGPQAGQDTSFTRAAFYGLYLRRVEGLAADEAAALVMERYPRTRPFLERLTRPAVVDPLYGKEGGE